LIRQMEGVQVIVVGADVHRTVGHCRRRLDDSLCRVVPKQCSGAGRVPQVRPSVGLTWDRTQDGCTSEVAFARVSVQNQDANPGHRALIILGGRNNCAVPGGLGSIFHSTQHSAFGSMLG